MLTCLRLIGTQLLFLVLFIPDPVHLQGNVESVTAYDAETQTGFAANLTCSYYPPDVGLYAVTWIQDPDGQNKQVYRYAAKSGTKEPSDELRGRSEYLHTQGKTTLVILNVTDELDGTYACNIEGDRNTKSSRLQLQSYHDARNRVNFGPPTIKIPKGSKVEIDITANCNKPTVDVYWSEEYEQNQTVPCTDSYLRTTFSRYYRNNVTSSYNVSATATHPSFANRQIKRNYEIFVEDIILKSVGPSTNILGKSSSLGWTFVPKDADIVHVMWLYKNFSEDSRSEIVYAANVSYPGTAYRHLEGRANYSMVPTGTISLLITRLRETDDGVYTCRVIAAGQYESEVNLTTQSDIESCIEWDQWTARSINENDSVIIYSRALCKPPVELDCKPEFLGLARQCSCADTNNFTECTFTHQNVTKRFQLTIVAKRYGLNVSSRIYTITIAKKPLHEAIVAALSLGGGAGLGCFVCFCVRKSKKLNKIKADSWMTKKDTVNYLKEMWGITKGKPNVDIWLKPNQGVSGGNQKANTNEGKDKFYLNDMEAILHIVKCVMQRLSENSSEELEKKILNRYQDKDKFNFEKLLVDFIDIYARDDGIRTSGVSVMSNMLKRSIEIVQKTTTNEVLETTEVDGLVKKILDKMAKT